MIGVESTALPANRTPKLPNHYPRRSPTPRAVPSILRDRRFWAGWSAKLIAPRIHRRILPRILPLEMGFKPAIQSVIRKCVPYHDRCPLTRFALSWWETTALSYTWTGPSLEVRMRSDRPHLANLTIEVNIKVPKPYKYAYLILPAT